MIQQWWGTVTRWLDETVRASAIKGLSETVEGKAFKKSLPPILAYIVVAAVLVGQLLLAQWPGSFAAFLLFSPLIATVLLSGLAVSARPSLAPSIPLYACAFFAVLVSLQCTMGAFAMCLPVHPNRTVFALASTIIVLGLMLGVSKGFVHRGMQGLAKARSRMRAQDPPATTSAPQDDSDSDAFTDAQD